MRFSTVLFLLAIWGVIHAAAVRAPANAASTSSQVNLKRAHHRKTPAKTEEDAHCKCNDNMFGAVEQKVLDDHKPTAKPTSLGKKPHDAPDKEAPHVKPTHKAPNKDAPHPKPSPKPSATHSKKPSAKPTTHKQSPTKAAPKAVTVTPKPIARGPAVVNGPIKTFTDTTFVTETAQITVTTIQTGLGKRDDTIDAPAPTTIADADSSDDDVPVTDTGALAFGDGFPDPNVDGTDDDDNDSVDNNGTLNHRDVEYDDEETSTAYQEMLEGEMVDDNAAGNQKRDVDYDEEETSLAYQESLEAEMFEANHPLNTKAKRNDAGINTWPAPPLEDEEDDSDLLAKRGSVMSGLSKVASKFESHAFKDTQKRDLDAEIARMTQEIEAHGGFIEKRNPEHHVDSKGRPCKGMHCAMEHNGHHWTAGQGFMPHDHRRDLPIVDDEELFLTDEDISKRNAEANNNPDHLLTDGDDDEISNRNAQPSYHTKQHGHEKPCTGHSMRCALANKGY